MFTRLRQASYATRAWAVDIGPGYLGLRFASSFAHAGLKPRTMA
jgi:hypothetical protein